MERCPQIDAGSCKPACRGAEWGRSKYGTKQKPLRKPLGVSFHASCRERCRGSSRQHPKAHSRPNGSSHSRQVECRDVFHFFFFNMPADLTPGLEMVVVLRQSRLKASGKESCGRTTSDENIPFSLGGSGKTFLNSAQI